MHTPEPSRTPATAVPRLAGSTIAAGVTFALARWWPFAWVPGEGLVILLFGIGFLGIVLTLALPKFAGRLPIRVEDVDGGVAIQARRVTINHPAYVALTAWGFGGVLAAAGGTAGPRGYPSVVWAGIAAICVFGLVYLLFQRPWTRRIELRPDKLVLHAGGEVAHIPWDALSEIGQAPLLANARSGMRHMREHNAAALMVTRSSDTPDPRRRRLENRFPTGDLACPFPVLLPFLQFLQMHPGERRVLTDPEATRTLLTAFAEDRLEVVTGAETGFRISGGVGPARPRIRKRGECQTLDVD